MVHRRKASSGGRKPMANHNRAWIWGRNVVTETLRAGIWPIAELALSSKLDDACFQKFSRQAESEHVPITVIDDEGLTKLCRAGDHQGCAARMMEFPYLTGDELRAKLIPNSRLIVLDRVQDPYNFGAMIRSAECLGFQGVVIGSASQVGVNSLVARSSAGAVNSVPIARVDDLTKFVQQLKTTGWQIWGATERGAIPLPEVNFQPPLALIIGNEGTGIHPELLAACTGTVQIPMTGRVGSLNAAVSAGILCYEVVRAGRK